MERNVDIMKITKEMVMQLNNELSIKGCPFRYKFVINEISGMNPQIEITLPSMSCVDSFIINPTKEFFDWLKTWFKIKGIELNCNNTGSVLWSNSGWNKEE